MSSHSSSAEMHRRSSLPADIGGTLTTGIDGHCCRGVELPSLNDSDAVWRFYEALLTPSLRAQIVVRKERASPTGIRTAQTGISEQSFLPDGIESARERRRRSPKTFAYFLIHYNVECATEARLVKRQLETWLDDKVFLGK